LGAGGKKKKGGGKKKKALFFFFKSTNLLLFHGVKKYRGLDFLHSPILGGGGPFWETPLQGLD